MYAFDYENININFNLNLNYIENIKNFNQIKPPFCIETEEFIHLGSLSTLSGIHHEQNAFVIGALTHHETISQSDELLVLLPALANLAANIGNRHTRINGTIGASLVNQSIGACYPCAALALNASIQTTHREISADDFFMKAHGATLEKGEIITSIRFPIPTRAAYLKFKQPASHFAMIGVFVAQTRKNGVNHVRVAITGAAKHVFRHKGLEAALQKDFSPESISKVQIDPSILSSDLYASAAYRAHLIRIQTQRAVACAGAT